MRFGTIGYNISTFAVAVMLMAYTMVMTFIISDQKGKMSTMLILYTNVAFVCVMIQMHVSSRRHQKI